MRVAALGAGLFLFLLLPPPALAPAQEAARDRVRKAAKDLGGDRRKGEFLVRFKPGADRRLAAVPGARFSRALRSRKEEAGRLHLVVFPAGTDEAAALAGLRADPAVESADPNYLRRLQVDPNDTSFGTQWALKNTGQSGGVVGADISATAAWNTTTGASTVVVGVMDTGVYLAHLDLAANIWLNPGDSTVNTVDEDGNAYVDDINGWDFVSNDNDPRDEQGHGTHVAGTIGAVGNNDLGVSGVCWSVGIMALRAGDADGVFADADSIEAFYYAAAKKTAGTNLVALNCSFGGGGFSSSLFDAIKACSDAGILISCAAGNESNDNDANPSYPASYDLAGIISVGSSTRSERPSSFSNYGASSVDLFAPGSEILSTYWSVAIPNALATLSGTSMAAPHVAGAIALVRSVHGAETAQQTRSRILYNGDYKAAYAGFCLTGRRLNVNASLQATAESTPPNAVADLAASDPSFSAVTLSWTAPGDDGAAPGTAATYDIRYSTALIDAGNFDAAAPVPDEPAPLPFGSAQTFRVRGLASAQTYYFALRTTDDFGNVSTISNVVNLATLAESTAITKFADDFEVGALDPSKWTATVDAPGSLAWGLQSFAGSNRAADSPNVNYVDDSDTSIRSANINLTGKRDSVLVFDHRHVLETAYDFGDVMASGDGGLSWRTLASFTGSQTSFLTSGRIRLDAFDGLTQVKIRFRLQSDVSITFSGWLVDNVRVLSAWNAAANAAPVATGQSRTLAEDSSLAITLAGTDSNDDPLTFVVTGRPSNGTLSGAPPNVTYTPIGNWNGSDSFTFTASDGLATSPAATVSLTVTPVADPPTASGQSVSTNEDTPLPITLVGSDPDGTTPSFVVVTPPANGLLSGGTGASRTYTPNADYNGPDSFTFRTSDGTSNSATATVNITVDPVNDAPVAIAQSVSTPLDTAVGVTLAGTDLETPGGLTFAVTAGPSNGTLSGSGASLTYTPNPGFTGTDTFQFTCSDGSDTSAAALVSLIVGAVAAAGGGCGLLGPEVLLGLALAAWWSRRRARRSAP
jgi:subtilisin family serine protease